MRPLALIILLLPLSAWAQDRHDIVERAVNDVILPGFTQLEHQTKDLASVARENCGEGDWALQEQFDAAFDAWIAVSHLRFGPTEINDRGYAMAFWPDSRGITPKILRQLITDQDPIAESVDEFAQVSIAARGFFALEYLLYDDTLSSFGAPDYRCQLVQVIAQDIAKNSHDILADWRSGYIEKLMHPTPDGPYRNDEEAAQELFKALSTGLEFTSEVRLGKPMGTIAKSHPRRAEAWRSGRSLRNVVVSLESLQQLADALSSDAPEIADEIDASFVNAYDKAAKVEDDPIFADVQNPLGRFKVEILQGAINLVRNEVSNELGPHLGVAAGFNSLDGD